MNPIRIFISSPGDVELERQVARRVIAQLQAEFGGNPAIEPYFWEYEPMRLTVDFQGQIPRTSTFDIVVCILWSRLGTPLGPQHRRPDGTAYQSGTEFEFEDAADSAKARGVPDLLVYRNRNDPIVKPRPKAERERQLAQFDALESFLEKWTRDGQIRTGALTSYSDLAQFEERFGEHLRKLVRARGPADAAASVRRPVTWSAGSPFRGLQPFEFEHAPVFRGRTRAIQDVIALLRGQYASRQSWAADGGGKAPPLFVLVSAMSGIGKSSLIRAGVLPLLTIPGVVEHIGLWRRAVMRPASGGLFAALAEALTAPEALPELLSDGTTKPMLAEMLRSNPAAAELLLKGGLSQAAARLYAEEEAELRTWETQFAAAGRAADAQRSRQNREALRQREAALALLLDQFEESFTTGDKAAEAERTAFLVALDALARSGRVFTMATVRSDFLARTSGLAVIGTLIREGALYQLEPPTMAELAQIIRDPAREAGLAFEQDRETGARLDDVLLAATQGDPAALPLLEFALDRLYDKRDADGLLTFKAYREMDRVEGALAQSAEACFSTLSPTAAVAFERVFAALVNLVEVRNEERPVRRRSAVSDVSRHPGAAEFVDRFAAARLLVLDKDAAGNGSVAVVHEALFSHWARLAAWIEENRDYLRVRSRIEQAAARWEAEGRPRDLLLPDGRLLAEAEDVLRHADLLALSESVRALVRESGAARRARRIRRVAAIAILTAGLAVASVVSWYQYQSYQRNQIEAKLFDYRQAVRQDEFKFLAHGRTDDSIKDAYDSTRQVLGLIDEIETMRGEPPEGWEDATAKAHEFGAVLLAELGDVDGSGREIEARKAMAPMQNAAGLKEVLERNPAMMSYALTVFDLKIELMIAKDYSTALLQQVPSLQEVLKTGNGADAAKASPSATDTRSETERERAELNYSMGFINLLNYMTQAFGREQDFVFLDIFLRRAESSHEKLGEWNNAENDYQRDAAACLQWLDLARKAIYVDSPDDRARMKRDAARRLVNAKADLAKFYSRRKDYAKALATAQDAVQTLAAQPELADEDDLRLGVRKLVVGALVSLDKGEDAFTEAQSGTEDRLKELRTRLLDAWSQTVRDYGSVENYWVSVGAPERAVEVAQSLVDTLEKEVQSGFDIPSESNLAGAYLSLSWRQLFAKRFADAQATAEKSLQLPVSEVRKAMLSTNLADALLLQGDTEKALAVYEAWKTKPVESEAEYPKLFAQAVLDDFAQLEEAGLLKGIDAVPTIRAEMQAAVAAAPKPPPKAAK